MNICITIQLFRLEWVLVFRSIVQAVLYPPVSFSQGSGVERRGWAVLHRWSCSPPDWIPSPPFISQLVPREEGCVSPRSEPLKCQKNAVGRGNRQWLERLWASVMFSIGDCRNFQRVGESTDHCSLVRSWRGRTDMWMRMICFQRLI